MFYYLYTMTSWGSKTVVLTMSHAYCKGEFKLENSDLQNLCHYIKVVVLSSVVLIR